MKRDSRRIERITASAVTIASSPKAAEAGIRFQRACAEKKVAKRIAMAAASSALAVAGYLRAALSSHATNSPTATAMPINTRTGGCSKPCSIEYFRKKIAATTSVKPAPAANNLTPTKRSKSNPDRNPPEGGGGSGGSGGCGGRGGIRGGAVAH